MITGILLKWRLKTPAFRWSREASAGKFQLSNLGAGFLSLEFHRNKLNCRSTTRQCGHKN